MCNKLIILSLALFLCVKGYSQTGLQADDTRISIYPNPAVESIYVQLDDDFSNVQFEMNSMIGNKVTIRPEEVGFGKYKISVEDLSTGYYFLIIKDEGKRFNKAYKFLKR